MDFTDGGMATVAVIGVCAPAELNASVGISVTPTPQGRIVLFEEMSGSYTHTRARARAHTHRRGR